METLISPFFSTSESFFIVHKPFSVIRNINIVTIAVEGWNPLPTLDFVTPFTHGLVVPSLPKTGAVREMFYEISGEYMVN